MVVQAASSRSSIFLFPSGPVWPAEAVPGLVSAAVPVHPRQSVPALRPYPLHLRRGPPLQRGAQLRHPAALGHHRLAAHHLHGEWRGPAPASSAGVARVPSLAGTGVTCCCWGGWGEVFAGGAEGESCRATIRTSAFVPCSGFSSWLCRASDPLGSAFLTQTSPPFQLVQPFVSDLCLWPVYKAWGLSHPSGVQRSLVTASLASPLSARPIAPGPTQGCDPRRWSRRAARDTAVLRPPNAEGCGGPVRRDSGLWPGCASQSMWLRNRRLGAGLASAALPWLEPLSEWAGLLQNFPLSLKRTAAAGAWAAFCHLCLVPLRTGTCRGIGCFCPLFIR